MVPLPWFVEEAELAVATTDAMSDEALEKLTAKVPSADRAELRAIA
jgi:hypothetical protein